MADQTVKGWRQVRAERSSGSRSAWYYRHNVMSIPEYSINMGWSKGFFWLTLALGRHRVVTDRYKNRGKAYDSRGSG